MVGTPSRPIRGTVTSHTGLLVPQDDEQVGLSISRVPTPAVPSTGTGSGGGEEAELVAVDLDLPATSTAAALIEEGHGTQGGRGHPRPAAGYGASEPGGKSIDDKRASSGDEVTVTDELSSSSSRGLNPSPNVFAWQGIECHVQDRADKTRELTLLHGISGAAQTSDLVAIIGPSGAGKSTLLDILSQRKTVGRLGGTVSYNGEAMSPKALQKLCSYVTQEDSFHPTITVLEAVLFQAHMRLDSAVPYAWKARKARALIRLAGLQGKEKSRIGGRLPGGIMVRGLSGGEKRRLSLVCGVMTNPEILFCDEATSGLDSLAALKICETLHDFCSAGMIVLCTIHQPRHSIWRLFSKVLILGKGHQLFYGTPDAAEEWFTVGLGLALPPKTSPSDFIMDMANVDFDKTHLYGSGCLRTVDDLERVAAAFREQHPGVFAAPGTASTADDSPTSPAAFKARLLLSQQQPQQQLAAARAAIRGGGSMQTTPSWAAFPPSPTNAAAEARHSGQPTPPTAATSPPSSLSTTPHLHLHPVREGQVALAGVSPSPADAAAAQAEANAAAAQDTLTKLMGLSSSFSLGATTLLRRATKSDWPFKYTVLLRRNFNAYCRNPGNVLARFLVYLSVAVITGLVLRNLGQDKQPRAFSDILGALFFHTMAMGLFPYASQSLFLFDRQFYQGENGARLYPTSCYYVANLTLELLLNAFNGFVYALISYYMLNYQAYVQAPNPGLSAFGFIGIVTLTNVVSNAQVLFFSLASPNFEVAFISSSGLTALSALLAGCVVSYPAVSLSSLQYISPTKYAYTAILLHFFKDNPRTVTPFGTVSEVMDAMEMTNPGTVWANILAMLGIYMLFNVAGFFCLKHLYKEQR